MSDINLKHIAQKMLERDVPDEVFQIRLTLAAETSKVLDELAEAQEELKQELKAVLNQRGEGFSEWSEGDYLQSRLATIKRALKD